MTKTIEMVTHLAILFLYFLGGVALLQLDSPKANMGVIYFAYHPNATLAATFVNNAAKSARSVKKFHPKLEITLMSNLNIPKTALANKGFNKQVKIAAQHMHNTIQWWTRIMYLNSTPYEYTLAIDSDRIVCSNISEGFEILMNGFKGKSYDLLQVSAGILPAFDNGVLFFHKGGKLNKLIDVWVRYQSAWDKYGNDQGCLANALDFINDNKKKSPMKNFNVGILPPTWQLKFIPAVGEHWGTDRTSRTLVVHGDIKIVAGKSCESFAPIRDKRTRIYTSWVDSNFNFNYNFTEVGHHHATHTHTRNRSIAMGYHHPLRNRSTAMGYHHGLGLGLGPNPERNRSLAVVYSQAECDQVLQNRCRHPEIDWKSVAYHVLPRLDYFERYYPVRDHREMCPPI